MKPEELEELQAEYERWWEEDQALVNDPVANLFDRVSFTSYSKGKTKSGRKRYRKWPITITLYHYRLDHNSWHTIEKMPLDSMATEVYGHSECYDEREAGLTERLIKELPERAEWK